LGEGAQANVFWANACFPPCRHADITPCTAPMRKLRTGIHFSTGSDGERYHVQILGGGSNAFPRFVAGRGVSAGATVASRAGPGGTARSGHAGSAAGDRGSYDSSTSAPLRDRSASSAGQFQRARRRLASTGGSGSQPGELAT